MPYTVDKTRYVDNQRAIYLVKYKGNSLTNEPKRKYYAKVFSNIPMNASDYPIITRDDGYKKNSQNLQEIETYYNLRHDPDVIKAVYYKKFVYSYHDIIKIDTRFVYLDFGDWARKYKLSPPFSILITEKIEDYVTFDKMILNDENNQYYKYLFIKIIKKIYQLNEVYNFVHGDLLTQNVLVNKSGEFKLFDFDISTISNQVSYAQCFYINYDYVFPLTGLLGFLFDFSRLYISILFGNNFKCIFNNKYKVLNDLVDLNCIYFDMYKHYLNDLNYFKEWLDMNGGAENVFYNVYRDFIRVSETNFLV